MNIPQFLTNWNMYTGGNKLMGIGAELTLPNFEAITETISGAGILGEFESAVPGAFKSLALEIPYRTIDREMFALASSGGSVPLTFRGSQQVYDPASGANVAQGVRIETRGPCKGIDPGKAAQGKPTEGKFTQEILFIAIYLDDAEVLCLDKLNFVYRVNGVDMLADIRKNI